MRNFKKKSLYFRKEKVRCINCNKIFYTPASSNRKYCSRNCYGQNNKGENHYKWNGGEVTKICLTCDKIFYIRKSQLKRGRGLFCCRNCYAIWQSENMKGKKNRSWKGGITPLYHKLRTSIKHEEWRKKVFERDNYICQICEYKKGHILQAHHIKSFINYKVGRYDINNGITLCKECHLNLHKSIKGGCKHYGRN